jgi:hypothetical protein
MDLALHPRFADNKTIYFTYPSRESAATRQRSRPHDTTARGSPAYATSLWPMPGVRRSATVARVSLLVPTAPST